LPSFRFGHRWGASIVRNNCRELSLTLFERYKHTKNNLMNIVFVPAGESKPRKAVTGGFFAVLAGFETLCFSFA
jgi:hypothetical protein